MHTIPPSPSEPGPAVDLETFGDILAELADELPEPFFHRLNGGICVEEQIKYSPHAQNDDLYVMGEYWQNGALGRQIRLYYGSFAALYPSASPRRWRREMRKTLRHEFRHHLESLAGLHALEDEDDEQLLAYYQRSTPAAERPHSFLSRLARHRR